MAFDLKMGILLSEKANGDARCVWMVLQTSELVLLVPN